MTSTPAAADESHAISDRYLDGLDSRHSASAIAQMARGAGYGATAATNGRTADNAWNEALNSSLFGFFGHANAGVLQVKDRAGVNNDEFFGAGTDADLLPVYAGFRLWTEFLPFVDVDDMRLAIFAGCYTANSHPSLGDLEDVAASRGVDAVVAFPKLVYFPSKCTSCNYSGNYFWDRFAVHYGGGTRLSVALSRARTDLVNKEGKAGGWGTYRITGSVDSPAAVRLRPASGGEPLTSDPTGIDQFTLATLNVTDSQPLPDGSIEQISREGVLVRSDADGEVIDVWAPSSTVGSKRVDVADLRASSRAIVTEVAGGSDWALTAEEDAFHVEGERLMRFTWRSSAPRPEIVEVEVDRRTGAVTYLGRAIAPHQDADPIAVTSDQAEAVALEASSAGSQIVSVVKHLWEAQTWVASTRNDTDRGPLGPQFEEFVIDAVTGDILRRTTT